MPPPPPPPPLQVGNQALGSKSPDFGRKMGRNLSEDLFFCSLPDFGRKMARNWSVTISNSDLYVPLKFSEISGPPFLKSFVRYCI